MKINTAHKPRIFIHDGMWHSHRVSVVGRLSTYKAAVDSANRAANSFVFRLNTPIMAARRAERKQK